MWTSFIIFVSSQYPDEICTLCLPRIFGWVHFRPMVSPGSQTGNVWLDTVLIAYLSDYPTDKTQCMQVGGKTFNPWLKTQKCFNLLSVHYMSSLCTSVTYQLVPSVTCLDFLIILSSVKAISSKDEFRSFPTIYLLFRISLYRSF